MRHRPCYVSSDSIPLIRAVLLGDLRSAEGKDAAVPDSIFIGNRGGRTLASSTEFSDPLEIGGVRSRQQLERAWLADLLKHPRRNPRRTRTHRFSNTRRSISPARQQQRSRAVRRRSQRGGRCRGGGCDERLRAPKSLSIVTTICDASRAHLRISASPGSRSQSATASTSCPASATTRAAPPHTHASRSTSPAVASVNHSRFRRPTQP